MIDEELLGEILEASTNVDHIVLVGDDAQLPSVHPGSVLRDLKNALEPVTLTKNFRLDQASQALASIFSAVRAGDATALHRHVNENVSVQSVFRLVEKDAIVPYLERIAHTMHEERAQIVCANHHSTLGTRALNKFVRQQLFPGRQNFGPGDRVMVTRNDHHLAIYNGDIGHVVSEHAQEDDQLYVAFPTPNGPRKISLSAIEHVLVSAYALTVHKAQGSEFEHVIFCIDQPVARSLIYTAITRARKSLTVVGDKGAFFDSLAVAEPRTTALATLLH